MARRKLGEILVQAGVLSQSGLQSALNEQRRWGGHVGNILVEMGLVSEDIMVQALSRQLNLPMVRLDQQPEPNVDVLALVPAEMADDYRIIPFNKEGKFLDVAMSEPTNLGIIDELRIRTQLNVRPYLAGPKAIQLALAKYYGRGAPEFSYGHGADSAAGAVRHLPPSVSLIEFDRTGAAQQKAPTADVTKSNGDASTVSSYPGGAAPIRYGSGAGRDAEIDALQGRLAKLEALVARDEDVLRKLLGLLVEKGVASRDEILERIK